LHRERKHRGQDREEVDGNEAHAQDHERVVPSSVVVDQEHQLLVRR